jgi:hypothetical protein
LLLLLLARNGDLGVKTVDGVREADGEWLLRNPRLVAVEFPLLPRLLPLALLSLPELVSLLQWVLV